MMRYSNILFTDYETVPQAKHFEDLPQRDQQVFKDRFPTKFEQASQADPATTNEELWEKVYQENAALHAEFCKIVSAGLGYFNILNPSAYEFKIKSIVSNDEVFILNEVKRIMEINNFTYICGHNSDSFDNPIVCRRMVINRIKIPYMLDPTGKKTWDLKWYDTMKMFAYGEWGHKTSLDRLCFALGVPTPKEDMDGFMVKDLFYGATPGPEDLPFGKFDKEEARFQAIAKYQCGDVLATANCFLRLNNEDIIPEERVKYV